MRLARSRLHLPPALLALAVLFLDVQWVVGQQADGQRLNGVFFLLDDLGCGDIRDEREARPETPGVSALGDQDRPRTPNSRKPAPSSLGFSDFHAGNPTSFPFRTALLTGSTAAPGQTVTVSCALGVGAGAKPIRDEAGGRAEGFKNRAVSHRTGDKKVRNGEALPERTVQQIEALLAEKAQRTPARRKVDSQLLDALRRARGQPAANRLVAVDIRAEVTPAVLARIRSLGGAVVNSVPRHRALRARIPLASVEKLAAWDGVQSIRTADQAIMRGQPGKLPSDVRTDAPGAAGGRKVNTSKGDVSH